MTLSEKIRKKVIGQKIVKFKLYPSWDEAGEKHYNPVIELENGVWVQFLVSESHGGGDYGITPIITE